MYCQSEHLFFFLRVDEDVGSDLDCSGLLEGWQLASAPSGGICLPLHRCHLEGRCALEGDGKGVCEEPVTQGSEFVPQDQFVSLFHDCRAGLWLLSAAFQKSQEWIINLHSFCLAVSGMGTLSPFISCEVSSLGSSPMIPLQLDNA